MIKVPKVKFNELPEVERKVFISFIREWCKVNGTFRYMHEMGVGIEECEESIINLCDKGVMKLLMKEEDGRKLFCLAIYDPFVKRYVAMKKSDKDEMGR